MLNELLFSGFIAAAVADTTSTHLAIQQGHRETVLSQSVIANDLLLGSSLALTSVMIHKLNNSHPKLTKVLLVTAIIWRASVTVNNLKVIRGVK